MHHKSHSDPLPAFQRMEAFDTLLRHRGDEPDCRSRLRREPGTSNTQKPADRGRQKEARNGCETDIPMFRRWTGLVIRQEPAPAGDRIEPRSERVRSAQYRR